MKWISLENEAPPIYSRVLLCNQTEYIEIGMIDEYGNLYNECGLILPSILYWRYLPQGPGQDDRK